MLKSGINLNITTFKFYFYFICTKQGRITGKSIDCNTEDEDEAIIEAVSHKFERNLVNPPNKIWGDSTQT